jgi:hypothetical protein
VIYLYISGTEDGRLEFIEIEPGVKVERWFRW